MKWLLRLFIEDRDYNIAIGSRIRTARGMGTVTGGTIHVRLDRPYRGKNGIENSGFSHNIGEMYEKVNKISEL